MTKSTYPGAKNTKSHSLPMPGIPPSSSSRDGFSGTGMAGYCLGRSSARTRNDSGRSRLFSAFILLLLFGSRGPANGAGTVQFGNGKVIDTDTYRPSWMYSADLDDDGDQDVLLLSYDGDYVRWYENQDGTGTLSEAVDISADSDGAVNLAVGDLDGDGFPDVVVASQLDNQITWFRNLAGDAFTVGGSVDVAKAFDVAMVDVDGDEDLDVVYTSQSNGLVGWYTNADGKGTLEVGRDISTTSIGAWKMAVADLTGDGNLDVVVAMLYGRVELFKNSDGVFSLGVELEEGTNSAGAMDIATADFDGDGDLDVVTASFDGSMDFLEFPLGRLILFKNDGAGSFEEGEDIGLLDSIRSVVAVDLDNDGDIDLVASDYTGGRIVWYDNDGQGGFSAAKDVALDVGVSRVIAADLDGDGDRDLVSCNIENNRLVWYENLLVEATPAPLQVPASSPQPTAAETLTQAPSSMTSPANPTQSPVSSTDRTPTSFAPIAAPIAPIAAPIGAEPTEVDNGSGDDDTTDLIIGVLSTLISTAIIAAVGLFCRSRQHRQ